MSEAAAAPSAAPAPSAEPVAPGSLIDSAPAPVASEAPAGSPAPNTEQANPNAIVTTEDNWRDKFSPELRNNPNLSKYKTLDDFANGHINLAKKIGEKGLEVPGEDATPEEWSNFHSKTGRPDTADAYTEWKAEVKVDADGNELPSFQLDQEVYSQVKGKLHDAGLSDKQQLAVMDLYAQTTQSGEEQVMQMQFEQANQTKSALMMEFGDKYEATMKTISATADALGIKQTLNENGLGNNLDVIKMLHTISSKIGESNIVGGTNGVSGGFEAQMSQLKSHPAYNNKSHPEYHTVQKSIQGLYKSRY